MGFLIYKKSDVGTNIHYERVQPLRLGGADGLIARHVKSMPADQTASWKLDFADGGPCGGDWRWGTPALQIGATVVPSR
jgi:hypothetical protein